MIFLLALLASLVVHVIDDFGLQHFTHLNELKQKTWWIEQCYVAKKYNYINTSIYKYDYIVCLILHAFKWSCLTILPGLLIIGFPPAIVLALLIFFNTAIHAVIDDFKANRFAINLIQDQAAHVLQIIMTIFLIYVII